MNNQLYYVCKYTPVELLRGLGADCVLLDHIPGSFDRSEELLHPNICGFGKSIIEAVLAGSVRELVLVNCCDTIRAAYEILRDMNACDFLYFCDLPHDDSSCSVELYAEEIRQLAMAYSEYKGTAFDAESFFNALKSNSHDDSPAPYAAILGARCPKALAKKIGESLPIATKNLSCAEGRALDAKTGASLLEAEFSPAFAPIDPKAYSDPDSPAWHALLASYARCLLGQLPCMRMRDVSGRKALFNDENLKAVIYNTVKFCDFYGFEYSEIKTLQNLPILKLETDYSNQSAGQMRTRVEAFGECLGALDRPAEGGNDGTDKQQRMDPDMKKETGNYYAGIDIGSTSTDAVLIDRDKNIIAKVIVPTSAKASNAFDSVLRQLLAQAGITRDDLAGMVTTGYGRDTVGADGKSVTEISCHAKGAHYLDPQVRSIIDIGGQDSKVICINDAGNVTNFVMNDKCAAGTGRFLEIMARTLELSIDEMARVGLKHNEDIVISSICTVFAESEIISLIAQNKETCDIVHGLNESVANKAVSLVNRVKAEPKFMMTGGVAKNDGVVQAISQKLKAEIATDEMAQCCGALGAALYALEGM